MRIVVCVKWIPILSALKFDPETRRLVRDGVPGELSGFDPRALGSAVAVRNAHGGEVVAVTMGPPGARDALVQCLALGADRAVHLCDPLLAGSDTLATARALAAVVRREAPDVVFFGRSSTDAETGQVGPEVAELLGLPQATAARTLGVDPTARTFVAERETDDGCETLEGPLPVVVTVTEDIAEERFPTKAERQAAAGKPIATIGVADVGLAADAVGAAGSPTWVAGVERVEVARRGEIVAGDSPEAQARALGERLRALRTERPAEPPRRLPPSAPNLDGPSVWVVVEEGRHGVHPVAFELLAKAAELASRLRGATDAVVLRASAGDPAADAALAAAGADRVASAEHPALAPYTTEVHAEALAYAIRARRPRIVLFGSTIRGRDLASRVAAILGLGLTGDAIGLEIDAEGRLRAHKPAFGGTIVAPVLSRTPPEMATVRAGILRPAAPDASRPLVRVELPIPAAPAPARVCVTATRTLDADPGAQLATASLVLGVGSGCKDADGVAPVVRLAEELGAAVAATRSVTDAGWLPRQHQVGLTGRSIAPHVYVALGVSGAMEHLVGLRRAGIIVAIHKNPKSPMLKAADLGVVADHAALLPYLADALRP